MDWLVDSSRLLAYLQQDAASRVGNIQVENHVSQHHFFWNVCHKDSCSGSMCPVKARLRGGAVCKYCPNGRPLMRSASWFAHGVEGLRLTHALMSESLNDPEFMLAFVLHPPPEDLLTQIHYLTVHRNRWSSQDRL
ncbi:hypothetical protein KC361_g28 [Hortaea werneckii]|nr:hypothetical protein KC361_g28 [Hortaea werneckii]